MYELLKIIDCVIIFFKILTDFGDKEKGVRSGNQPRSNGPSTHNVSWLKGIDWRTRVCDEVCVLPVPVRGPRPLLFGDTTVPRLRRPDVCGHWGPVGLRRSKTRVRVPTWCFGRLWFSLSYVQLRVRSYYMRWILVSGFKSFSNWGSWLVDKVESLLQIHVHPYGGGLCHLFNIDFFCL